MCARAFMCTLFVEIYIVKTSKSAEVASTHFFNACANAFSLSLFFDDTKTTLLI